MDALVEKLRDKHFFDIEPALRYKSLRLVNELEPSFTFVETDPLIVLHDIYLHSENREYARRIEQMAEKIVMSMANISHKTNNVPSKIQRHAARKIENIGIKDDGRIENVLNGLKEKWIEKVPGIESGLKLIRDAKKTAEGIEDSDNRAWALKDIAVEEAKAGFIEEAKKTAEGIEDSDNRAWALKDIAVEEAKAGFIEEAKKDC
jgi:hypothetical protein